jgi:hypothetical protein
MVVVTASDTLCTSSPADRGRTHSRPRYRGRDPDRHRGIIAPKEDAARAVRHLVRSRASGHRRPAGPGVTALVGQDAEAAPGRPGSGGPCCPHQSRSRGAHHRPDVHRRHQERRPVPLLVAEPGVSTVSIPQRLLRSDRSWATRGSHRVGRGTASEEQEPVLADLNLVAVVESRHIDPVTIDVGAIEPALICHCPTGPSAAEFGMLAGHGDVVEKDVTVGMPPEPDDIVIQQEPVAGLVISHHKQRVPGRKTRHLGRLRLVKTSVVGRGLHGSYGRERRRGAQQVASAVRAEATPWQSPVATRRAINQRGPLETELSPSAFRYRTLQPVTRAVTRPRRRVAQRSRECSAEPRAGN